MRRSSCDHIGVVNIVFTSNISYEELCKFWYSLHVFILMFYSWLHKIYFRNFLGALKPAIPLSRRISSAHELSNYQSIIVLETKKYDLIQSFTLSFTLWLKFSLFTNPLFKSPSYLHIFPYHVWFEMLAYPRHHIVYMDVITEKWATA